MNRPRPAIRIAILVAAVACLGLAMCARARPTQPNPPAATTQAPTQPAPADAAPAAKPQGDEGTMHQREPDRFPATKAPGRLY